MLTGSRGFSCGFERKLEVEGTSPSRKRIMGNDVGGTSGRHLLPWSTACIFLDNLVDHSMPILECGCVLSIPLRILAHNKTECEYVSLDVNAAKLLSASTMFG